MKKMNSYSLADWPTAFGAPQDCKKILRQTGKLIEASDASYTSTNSYTSAKGHFYEKSPQLLLQFIQANDV